MERPIDVVVVEDEALMRRSVIRRIEEAGGFRVVGEARSGNEALRLVRLLKPEVVFSDIVMPEMDGIELARQMQISFPQIRMVIVSGYRDFSHAQNAMRYGVTNYLLKPLTPESFAEAMDKLRAQIGQQRSTASRSRLERQFYGESPETAGQERYQVCLATLGHVLSASPPMDQAIRFKQHWSRIFSSAQMPDVQGRLSVLPGSFDNERYCIRTMMDGGGCEPSAREFAQMLFEAFKPYTEGLPLNLHYAEGCVRGEALYEARCRLKNAQTERLIVGRSDAVGVNGSAGAARPAEKRLVSPGQLNVLKALYVDGCMDALRGELLSMVRQMIGNGCEQYAMENTLGHVFWLLYAGAEGEDLSKRRQFSREINAQLSVAVNGEAFAEYAADRMISLLAAEAPEKGSDELIAQALEEYLRLHFADQLSMEAVARQMGFSLAYLTKVFKRCRGTSPLKYLISLRMEHAKELLRSYPQMDVASVGAACGYEDAHYFSRIFKNAMGISPTKYRDQGE